MEISEGERLFFSFRPQALPLYLLLRERLLENAGVTLTVHKTQISFYTRRLFACISTPPAKRLGEEAVMVSFVLPWPLASQRLFGRADGPGKHTCHVVLSQAEQLDEELLGWLEEAYMFACRP